MNKKFLKEYLNAFAPTGQEAEGQKIWMDYIKPYVSVLKKDAYGTAWGILRTSKQCFDPYKVKKVIIEAHCDEIAWIITHIEKDGYVRVERHGGSDNMIAPSKSVLIHTHNGEKINAVFGSPAIHVRDKEVEKCPSQDELWLDVGVDSDEKVKELGIEVGCLVTFDDKFYELGDYYVGRSLDDKIGGYVIAEVMRIIHEEKIDLPFDLYVVNSVQEEVGLFGAKMVAKRIKADIAIVHDVCHNTNHPKMNKAKDGDIEGGKGVCIEYTAQNHRGIIKKIREVAKEKEIPLQLTVGSYGNDTIGFFLENTPTAIIAMPLKYMHTTVEMAHKEDVDNAIKLMIETLKAITPEWIEEISDIKVYE